MLGNSNKHRAKYESKRDANTGWMCGVIKEDRIKGSIDVSKTVNGMSVYILEWRTCDEKK